MFLREGSHVGCVNLLFEYLFIGNALDMSHATTIPQMLFQHMFFPALLSVQCWFWGQLLDRGRLRSVRQPRSARVNQSTNKMNLRC